MITKLRLDADQASLERNEAMNELERFRESLKMRSIDYDLKMTQQKLYGFTPSKVENFRAYQQNFFSKENDSFQQNKMLTVETKFVPLVSAGQSMVSTGLTVLKSRDYEDIESTEVKNQLAELDLLLNNNS